MRHLWLAFVVALTCSSALTTAVAAEPSPTIEVRDAADVTLEGAFEATLPGGGGHILAWASTGTYELRDVTGTITIWSSREQNAWALTSIVVPTEPWQNEAIPLDGATIRLDAIDETVSVRIAMEPDARVRIRGDASETGLPRWLERAIAENGPNPLPGLASDRVVWTWEAGWPFLGSFPQITDLVGFPLLAAPSASLEGEGRLQLAGGNLSFVDATGAPREVRLGNWSESSDLNVTGVRVRDQVVQYALFEGTIGSASIPIHEHWGISGPSVEWRTDGLVRWRLADGVVRTGSGSTPFEDATLSARGTILATPAPSGPVPAAGRARYGVEGEIEEIRVNGRPVVAAERADLRPLATGMTLGGVLLAVIAWTTSAFGALAARIMVPFYSRIGPGDALVHPTRARIRSAVEARPGIHLRELHRIVGGAWGPFSFHVHVLARMGLLVLRREGRYRAAHVPGADPEPAARGTQARVLELARRTGPVSATAIAAELGISPRLARYHLKALRERGMLEKA